MARTSVKGAAKRAAAEDAAAREDRAGPTRTQDSFTNAAHRLGVGTDNPTSDGTYSFNPISRNRILLDWMYRGSWIAGMAVDVLADDMTRAGVEHQGDLPPEEIERIEEAATAIGMWNRVNDAIKWGRLYGGAIAVLLIDGQDTATPLRGETIMKGQFKGLLILDRWMVEPDLSNLVTEYGPSLGQPKFYRVTADAPALRRMTIHHSRVFRFEGDPLPFWQRLQENLWGLSVMERLYDRLLAFDSATTGAAQLVYRCWLRTLKVDGLRAIQAEGGPALEGLSKYVDLMRRYQTVEGLTLIDGKDDFGTQQHQAFSGLADALVQFGQQLSGALQIPLVRLFGQSPAGLNSTGESDLRTYYDGIKQRQEKSLRVPMTVLYRILARSAGIALPKGYRIEFRNLWQLSDTEKAEIANKVVEATARADEAGLISQKVGMQELKQSSRITGVFSNISDEDIEAADDSVQPPMPDETAPGAGDAPGAPPEQSPGPAGQGDISPPPASPGANPGADGSATPRSTVQ